MLIFQGVCPIQAYPAFFSLNSPTSFFSIPFPQMDEVVVVCSYLSPRSWFQNVSKIFYFHPYEFMIHFDLRIFFSDAWEKTHQLEPPG